MGLKLKTKRVGICRREVLEPEVKGKNPKKAILGTLTITDGDIKSAVRSALRRLWSASTRRVFIEKVRFKSLIKDREVWCVKCEECPKIMGVSEKAFFNLKSGAISKVKRSLFDVDHLTGSPGFEDLESDLGKWAKNLFYGEMRILCRECHLDRTKIQGENR